ncbi:MAG: DUF4328 domain-containing protein [Opitutales bacterium]|nr:DUF4328 domain-containing protein [Opitutales bacterium]
MSDAAVAVLYKRGEITKSTKVWSPSMKDWTTLEKSKIYFQIMRGRTNRHLIELENATRLFRAFLVSLLVCLAFGIYFYAENIPMYQNYLDAADKLDKVDLGIKLSENAMLKKLISLIIFAMFAATLYCGLKWVHVAVVNAKLFTKRFTYSSNFSAASFAIPIINMIIPFQVLSEVLRSSLKAVKSQPKASQVIMAITWEIFWVASIVMFVISFFILPSSCPPDFFLPMYFSKIFIFSTYIVAAVLTLMFVSSIYGLQKERLKSISRRP